MILAALTDFPTRALVSAHYAPYYRIDACDLGWRIYTSRCDYDTAKKNAKALSKANTRKI